MLVPIRADDSLYPPELTPSPQTPAAIQQANKKGKKGQSVTQKNPPSLARCTSEVTNNHTFICMTTQTPVPVTICLNGVHMRNEHNTEESERMSGGWGSTQRKAPRQNRLGQSPSLQEAALRSCLEICLLSRGHRRGQLH